MFEKEAQRSFDELDDRGVGDNWSIEESYVNAFSNGAEFGYNKANEWHYPSKGELPKEFDKPYLCEVYSHFEVGYFTAYKDQPWHFNEYYLDNEDVIAWKEIVLPKESE